MRIKYKDIIYDVLERAGEEDQLLRVKMKSVFEWLLLSDVDEIEIECEQCNEEKFVENGTWALDNNMCETCYCAYQGG